MNAPQLPLRVVVMIGLLSLLIVAVQWGGVRLALDKLELSPESAGILIMVSLLGSMINIPVVRLSADDSAARRGVPLYPWLRSPHPFTGTTLITTNVGGCVVPVLFSVSLLLRQPVAIEDLSLAIAGVTLISFLFSRPIPGLGIAMPVLIAPLAAALIASGLDTDAAPRLAYIAGTWGVLLGADILRLRDILRMGVPYAHIGGAGTFDGVFITGIVAVLLT